MLIKRVLKVAPNVGAWFKRSIWLLFFLSIILLTAYSIQLFSNQIGITLGVFGKVYQFLVSYILGWYVIDGMVPRKWKRWWPSFKGGQIKLNVRFTRKVISLLLILIGLTGASLHVAEVNIPEICSDAICISKDGQNFLLAYTGIFIAAFGWMYTNFQRELSDRNANTLAIIRDQVYGGYIDSVYRQLLAFNNFIETRNNSISDGILSSDSFEMKLTDIPENIRPSGDNNITLKYTVTQILNTLDLIALGVREGQFYTHIVESVLRYRFHGLNFIFSNYIRVRTSATYNESLNRYVSTNRIWENFLWICTVLPVYNSDKMDTHDINRACYHQTSIYQVDI